jgi:hypothetical protein
MAKWAVEARGVSTRQACADFTVSLETMKIVRELPKLNIA